MSRETTAWHEGGHVSAAVLVGAEIEGAHIRAGHWHNGEAHVGLALSRDSLEQAWWQAVGGELVELQPTGWPALRLNDQRVEARRRHSIVGLQRRLRVLAHTHNVLRRELAQIRAVPCYVVRLAGIEDGAIRSWCRAPARHGLGQRLRLLCMLLHRCPQLFDWCVHSYLLWDIRPCHLPSQRTSSEHLVP